MDNFGYSQEVIVGYFPWILNLDKEDVTGYTLDNFGRYEHGYLA
jgi:hypothetical protein